MYRCHVEKCTGNNSKMSINCCMQSTPPCLRSQFEEIVRYIHMCDNTKLGLGDKIVKFIPLCTAMNARFILQSTAAISWRKHDSLIRKLQLRTVHHKQAYTVWTQLVHGAWVPVLDTRSRQVELYQDIETMHGTLLPELHVGFYYSLFDNLKADCDRLLLRPL